MTSQQLTCSCIAVSIIVHLWLVNFEWISEPEAGDTQIAIPVNFDVPPIRSADKTALGQQVADSSNEKQAEEQARKLERLARKCYLVKVREAVEQRKFLPGNGDLSGLIGNVQYSFHIRKDDSFTYIRLIRSSGNPLLDTAAGRAVAAASGVVKRPGILRGQSFNIRITVKYQRNM
ncbi:MULTISPECIES: TonB family protein [unclassified Maridesulfovibrio]|uniref:TonB family protein n=1 Tax=unclassified Maridesulfovibrio TaxID=2794999 RepID=UPI003B3E6BEA